MKEPQGSQEPKETFAELGFGPELLAELTALGYEEPTPIQKAAAGPLMAGQDLLGQAATGTGKTAAFALPLLQRLAGQRAEPGQPLVLVLVPTRELAVQVSEAFHRYGRGLRIGVAPIYGGQEFHRQVTALRRGAHVAIATPGRVLDHMRRGTIDLSALKAVVLDEADEMLDMGFAEDLELILEAAPAAPARQTALFSATLPPRIAGIAERHLSNPVRVLIPREAPKKGEGPKVRQTAYIVPRAHKIAALGRVLDLESPTLAIIFCRTRLEVDELTERLVGRGYAVEALHGGMSQNERDRVMKKARANQVDLMVATDVAARGIDIEHLSHVVNFDVPSSPEAYVHRIGRTGRAGREGVAITLAEPREHRLVRNIEWATKQRIDIATVPTPLDVKARRLDVTRGTLRETLIAAQADDALEGFRGVVESLSAEYDPMDVAAAAVKLAHEATAGAGGNDDEVQIPSYESFARPEPRGARPPWGHAPAERPRAGPYRPGPPPRGEWPREDRPREDGPRTDAPRTGRPAAPAAGDGAPVGPAPPAKRRPDGAAPAKRPASPHASSPQAPGSHSPSSHLPSSHSPSSRARSTRPAPERPHPEPGRFERQRGDMVRIYIGAGRKLGMRPADLVGAIANEAQVNARGIGDIEIADTFSLVELPEADAERVVAALSGATLRGRKVAVRRDDGRRKRSA